MKKLLVILGPTSTGKTDLALSMAKKFNGELVACDSKQVYQGLDIGTGKYPSKNSKFEIRNSKLKKQNGYWELDGVKIWMYDVVSLKRQYTVYDYVGDANRVIGEINKKGKLPIVVGGTGFYLKALLEGLPGLSVPVDKALRKKLEKLFLKDLQNKLQRISLKRWEKMNTSDRQNSRRLVRAIELSMMYPYREKTQILNLKSQNYNLLRIGLIVPREILYKKINSRVLEWLDNRIVAEVEKLLKSGVSKERIQALGLEYRVIVEYMDKKITLEKLIEKMQSKTRQYAKRQITWFKKEKDINWFDITEKNSVSKIEKVARRWYDNDVYVPEN